eukprot:ANDGO_01367.mRNA.1 hypothetical protein
MATKEAEAQKSRLDSVQSHVDADESSSIDTGRAAEALASLKQSTKSSAQPTVILQKQDIDLLVSEMDISETEAQNLLIKAGGNFQTALQSLVSSSAP